MGGRLSSGRFPFPDGSLMPSHGLKGIRRSCLAAVSMRSRTWKAFVTELAASGPPFPSQIEFTQFWTSSQVMSTRRTVPNRFSTWLRQDRLSRSMVFSSSCAVCDSHQSGCHFVSVISPRAGSIHRRSRTSVRNRSRKASASSSMSKFFACSRWPGGV
ncbi:hypothetical protein SCALM49S_04445 [Streptomyces californicus]